MTTPVVITGFEGWPAAPTTNGTGLATSVVGTVSVVTTYAHTGSKSLRVNPAAGTAYVRLRTGIAGEQIGVCRVYVMFQSLPPTGSIAPIIDMDQATGKASVGVNGNGKWYAWVGNGTTITDTVGPTIGVWYRVDARANLSGNPNVLDWQIDGVDKPQASSAIAAEDILGLYVGSASTTTADYYIDDVVYSLTSGDYPIGPGGTERLAPSSDGTHNAGTNTMEDQAGNDVGAVTAYDKLNSDPPDATTYIRQATIGTGNYAEVNLGDISASHSAIIGVQARLAYTSATTSTNKGATIISKDNFSSQTDIWGNPTTRADMSDGATNNLYFKSVIVSGAVDDTTVNALKVRLGYSDDVTPNPYWVDIWAEVAYTTSSGPQTFNQSVGGTLGLSGVVGKRTNKPVSGSLGLSGIIARLTRHPLGGSISPSGSISIRRVYSVVLSGLLGLSGTISRKTSKSFSGTIGPSGMLSRFVSKTLSGSISPSGSLSMRNVFSIVISGVLNLSGSVQKTSSKVLSGSLPLSGTLTRLTKKIVSGMLGLSGFMSTGSTYFINLVGTLNLSGGVTKKTTKSLSGVLGLSGGVVRKTFKMVSGVLNLSGSTIASLGSHVYTVFISGTLNLSGEIQRTTKKSVSGLITPVGSLAKMVSKTIGGLLHFIGSLIPFKPVQTFKTPHVRIYAISEELRIYSIIEPDRLTALLEEIKCYAIEQEVRIASIDDESRTYPIGG